MARSELFSKGDIKKIKRLVLEEGLNDTEISVIMNCHRLTVTRARLRHGIPRPDLMKRKDKEQVCKRCGKTTLIRRQHRIRKYCTTCQLIRNEELREKKRVYMQARQK